MGRFAFPALLFAVVSVALFLETSARSTSYNGYGYGQRAPPAVAANGSGRRSGQLMVGSEPSNIVEQPKAQDKKSSGPAMSAWGIIAIIMTLCLSLMGVYYFTLFYPILCKKERKYDVMDLGSQ
ncbi:Phosphoheptose isomerase [Frankliniella fusca]|uniref:Phosphoheptose isomerase n=1 Tax=Frankliniella fusca TaxID=407009 RepID=A0AAE1HQH7_9NEOP|nr:Phosphoheptose isomerase [Frankliniella fusca]